MFNMLLATVIRVGLVALVFGITSPIYIIFPESDIAVFVWFIVSAGILIWIAVKYFGQKLF